MRAIKLAIVTAVALGLAAPAFAQSVTAPKASDTVKTEKTIEAPAKPADKTVSTSASTGTSTDVKADTKTLTPAVKASNGKMTATKTTAKKTSHHHKKAKTATKS